MTSAAFFVDRRVTVVGGLAPTRARCLSPRVSAPDSPAQGGSRCLLWRRLPTADAQPRARMQPDGPNRHSNRAFNGLCGMRRAVSSPSLSDTRPQTGVFNAIAAHAGRCPTTLNTYGHW